jgi:Fe-Mn family superoxide dismutase
MRRAFFSGRLQVAGCAFTTFPDLKAPASLPALPFDWKDGVRPVFTPRQMELHYTKHHKAYIDRFNAVAAKGEFDGMTFEEIIQRVAKDPSKKVLFNQAAQHFNHTFFWSCITPNGSPASNVLKGAIAEEFGSFEAFQKKFEEAGISNFGSGWTWLVYNPASGKLQIDNTSNAGCPIAENLIPLFTADVWEHAYYKDFENRRADFLLELWKVANWSFVEGQLAKAKK